MIKFLSSVFILAVLGSCSMGKANSLFDVSAQVNRQSFDDEKGIRIEVYPIDRAVP